MPSTIIMFSLIAFASVFIVLAAWALLSNRGEMSKGVGARLRGVRQIKDYELGDTLASVEKTKKQAKERQKDIVHKKAFSEIPVLQDRFSGQPWAEKMQAHLRQAQLPLSLTLFMLLSIGCGIMGALTAIVWKISSAGTPLTVFAPVGFLVFLPLPYVYVAAAVARRMKRFSVQFPDALDLLSSSVKSGQALNNAIQNVADEMPEPVCDEFRVLADELSIGVEMTDALRRMSRRVQSQDVQFFCTALMIQKEVGGNLSEVLDGLQKTIRERFRILRQVQTLTAQGRLSGWIVAALPFGLMGVMSFMNWGYMEELFKPDGPGPKLLAMAVILQIIGMFFIRKIVNIKV